MRHLRPFALALLATLAGCVEPDPADDLATTEQELDISWDGSFNVVNTASATVNYKEIYAGQLVAGATIRLSTSRFGGSTWGPDHFPYLRLGSYDTGGFRDVMRAEGRYPRQLATDNNAELVYTAPRTQHVYLRIGCKWNWGCGGVVGRNVDFDSNGQLRNVELAFDDIGRRGTGYRSGFWWNGLMENRNDWWSNCPWDASCHNQGMTRLRTGVDGKGPANWLMFTRNEAANLYFVQLGSLNGSTGMFAQNANPPPGNNLIVARKDTMYDAQAGTGSYEHAGGIQAIGHYVMVGVENNGGSSGSYLRLWDVANPTMAAYRGGEWRSDVQAAAIGMTKIGTRATPSIDGTIPVDRWMMAIAGAGSRSVVFQTKLATTGTSLGDGMTGWSPPTTWTVKNCTTYSLGGAPYEVCEADAARPGLSKAFRSYQGLNLLTEVSVNGQPGRVFLLGTVKEGNTDLAELFEVSSWDFGTRPSTCPSTQTYCLEKVRSLTLSCDGGCNFDGAAGAFLDADRDRLVLYGQEHDKSTTASWQTFKEF